MDIAAPPTPLILAGLAAIAWLILMSFMQRGRSPYGSARWARPWELRRVGLRGRGGLFLGRSWFKDLYHHGEGHLLTIGGTGGGKSVGLVVPALLELTEGAVIVTDPSGELAAMTMRDRARQGSVVLLNPFHEVFSLGTGIDYPDTGFNPLSVLDPKLSTFKADCDALARLLMVTDRKESGSYFNDEGAEFLSLTIAATVLYDDPELHTLTFIYERVRDNEEQLLYWFDDLIDHGHPSIKFEAERFHGILKRSPNQWDGIASKAALATKRYAPSTPLGDHVAKDGFDASKLKTENVTVYILVPPAQLATALPWMNLVIGIFGVAIGRPGKARQVTLLIDEAPALGYLPDLKEFLAQFRKVGLRIWIFTQTVAQMADESLYGQTGFKAIMGLCSVKQFFAVREKDAAMMISDMSGERTARNISENVSGESTANVGVPLIRPEQVRGLRKWRQIIIVDELPNPIRAKLVPFFKRRAWRARTDKNPYRS